MGRYLGMVQLKVRDGIWRVIRNDQCLLETRDEDKARAVYSAHKQRLEQIKQEASKSWTVVDELH